MNALKLANAARGFASMHEGYLSATVTRQIAEAYLARWLSAQDNPAAALDTFEGALSILRGSV